MFDHIPLNALALKQGDYDRCFLAYVIGFGVMLLLIGFHPGAVRKGSALAPAAAPATAILPTKT